MNPLAKRAILSILGAAAIGVAVAPAALATTNTYGPQSWSNGTSTGRYRAHVGNHYIALLDCSGRYVVDLRVDIPLAPDVSEGRYSYACNSPGQLSGRYDTYHSDYRGHFMQSGSTWYGTMRDNHS